MTVRVASVRRTTIRVTVGVGTAVAAFVASGVLSLPAPVIQGVATASGAAVSASGTLMLPAPRLQGTAALGPAPVTALGTLSLPAPTIQGTATAGVAPVVASGSLALPVPVVQGTAVSGIVTNSVFADDAMVQQIIDPAMVIGTRTLVNAVSGSQTRGNSELHIHDGNERYTVPLHVHMENTTAAEDHIPGGQCMSSLGHSIQTCQRHQDARGGGIRVSLSPITNRASLEHWSDWFPFGTGVYSANSYSKPIRLSDNVIRVFQRGNVGVTSTSPQRMVTCTEASLLAGAPSFTSTELCRNPGNRTYGTYRQSPVNPDRIYVALIPANAGEGSAPVYCFYLELVAGVLKPFRMNGTEILAGFGFDVTTELTGTCIARSDASNIVCDMMIGPDGHPRIIEANGPGGFATTHTYRHLRFTGTSWADSAAIPGNPAQTNLPDAIGQLGGADFDGRDCTRYAIATDGASFKEIRIYQMDEATGIATLVENATPSPPRHQFRPFSPTNYQFDFQWGWVDRISFTDFTTYEGALIKRGFGVVRDVDAADPAGFEAETDAAVARMTTAPTAVVKRRINEWMREMKACPASGINHLTNAKIVRFYGAADEQAAMIPYVAPLTTPTKVGAVVTTAFKGTRGPTNSDYWNDVDYSTLTGLNANSMVIATFHQPSATLTGEAISWVSGTNGILITNSGGGQVRVNGTPDAIASGSPAAPNCGFSTIGVRDSLTRCRNFTDGIVRATVTSSGDGTIATGNRVIGKNSGINHLGTYVGPYVNDNAVRGLNNIYYRHARRMKSLVI